ncbi:MAG TPA: acylglycerol kinase family protein, partial [Actinomycetota bacterium]
MEKVLLISNARAGSVSARTKEVIVKALSADFKLEVADTAARNHATELARDAVDRDFDAVLVFGGDGTINEAAQPLIGSDVALGILPGGSTNVMARSLGVPRDPVE